MVLIDDYFLPFSNFQSDSFPNVFSDCIFIHVMIFLLGILWILALHALPYPGFSSSGCIGFQFLFYAISDQEFSVLLSLQSLTCHFALSIDPWTDFSPADSSSIEYSDLNGSFLHFLFTFYFIRPFDVFRRYCSSGLLSRPFSRLALGVSESYFLRHFLGPSILSNWKLHFLSLLVSFVSLLVKYFQV